MTITPSKSEPGKGKALVILEYVLLALCLCVIALRVTFTESPTAQRSGLTDNPGDTVYSLSVSGVLIFSFVVWLLWSLCSSRFIYRRTGLEIGLCIFIAAAVVSGFAAADKRLAITDIAALLAPLLTALLLVQILDSQAKIKLVLVVIAALGVTAAHQSAEQFLGGNQATIDAYESDPQSLLAPLGIEPNTFQHFMLEHRLYSKGVRSFFTTRNSAGSFALLALFAGAALFIDKLRNRRADSSQLYILASGIAVAVILLSLVVTRSKGAFIGLFAAVGVFVMYVRFGAWIKANRKALVIGCVLLGVAATLAVAFYGLKHGRLPGGGSMLVRWQYWHAAAKMYADHPLTGVGPGNFTNFYTHYKPAAAMESVADPHNFALSILTQYGPLGLVGFLLMLAAPIWAALSGAFANSAPKKLGASPAFTKPAIIFAIVISAALLIVRPIVFPLPATSSPEERQAGILIFYIMPVAVFLVGMLMMGAGETQMKKSVASVIPAALLSAAVGLLIHNLIDFAIFEPGVSATFWAMIACLIAGESNRSSRPQFAFRPAPVIRLLAVAGASAAVFAYLSFALVPVAASAARTRQARQAMTFNQFDRAGELLDSAANDDPLSPAALALNGRLYLRHFEQVPDADRDLLFGAEKRLLAAIGRNDASFKNFERLVEVYMLLAETAPAQDKSPWVETAFEAGSQAVERYPGCARLRMELARIAEQLGKNEIAAEQYQKAIDIEDSYRRQFKAIYGEREEIVSRLDEDKYLFAKDRLKSLSESKSP